MTRTAFVLPGQGGYLPGILEKFSDHPVVEDTLAAVDSVAARLGCQPVSAYLTSPDAPTANDLVASDPGALHRAIYATGVAATRLLADYCGLKPDLIIGHSFGEIVGLAAAGVFTVEDGTYVVAQRDEALVRFDAKPGGMVALGTNYRRGMHLLAAVDAWDLAVAVDNAPDQIVVSGPQDQLESLILAAQVLGIATTRLRIRYPFHNNVLGAAAEDFQRRIAEVPRRSPSVRIYSPLLSRYIDSTADVDTLVVGHLTMPARFLAAVRTVHDDGVTLFVEGGAKGTCIDFIKRTVVGAETIAPLRTRSDAAELRTSPASKTAFVLNAGCAESDRPTLDRPNPQTHVTSRMDVDSVLATASDIFSQAVGYPLEAFTPESDLESDLGIDSIKQIAVFGRILDHYGLTMPEPQPRLTSYPTLSAVATLITDIHGAQSS